MRGKKGRKPIVRTTEELLASAERTQQIRTEIERAGATVTETAFHAGISTQCFYTWMREGLTESRYFRLINAIGAARKAREAGR